MNEYNSEELIGLKKQVNLLREELQNQRIENLNLSKKLYEQLEKEEEFIKKYAAISQKYSALKNSKLGKLTVRYWNFKNRR